jgi:hypothetical protein
MSEQVKINHMAGVLYAFCMLFGFQNAYKAVISPVLAAMQSRR